MNTKILSASVSLALLLVSASASADLIIDDGSRKPTVPAVSSVNQAAPSSDNAVRSPSGQHGQWRNYGSPVSAASNNQANQTLSQSGVRPASVATAGWAKDMPLSLALRQVVPAEFNIKDNGTSLNKNVSWSGDRPWDQTLADLSRQGGFVSHISWDKKEVSLAPITAASLTASSVAAAPVTPVAVTKPATTTASADAAAEAAVARSSVPAQISAPVASAPAPIVAAPVSHERPTPSSHDKEGANVVATPAKPKYSAVTISETVSPQFVAATRPIATAPVIAQWALNPSLTLRENIEAWSKRAGWTLVWEAADYPIVASASFSGDFASPEGPLAKLITAYEGSDQPLIANLTTADKVVYVRNKHYERTQVVPTSPLELTPQH